MQIRDNHLVKLPLATPPQEGNCRVQIRGNTTPSGFACHPSAGGELPGAGTTTPPRQAAPATPPQEGNCLVQVRQHHPVRLRLPPLHRRGIDSCRYETTTPSGCACHPSTGGELFGPISGVDLMIVQNTTPSGCACHPSAGGELPGAGTTTPPRQAAPPSLRRRGIDLSGRQPPRQASPTPPQEGN